MELKFKGAIFEDYEINEEGLRWSRICEECSSSNQNSITKDYLDEDGSGSCGIKGCFNECDYYIDFKRKGRE